ncbi:hypothetical protein IC757_09640 [Wenzhouxiangella sp. AB-CW3]|uniref:hypothetical protein n=1 Tax=Wenzhouxiangella sp. AB-CW3 TaxID=2771012 RepID=UPI00168BEE9B|nr:hypothetical protein [Wenzhouxiangella sp. AB-CW3]QOC21317.1 hypothetical protein IC757_09640 [Wenzhouxiangella sp. AB-CW3]
MRSTRFNRVTFPGILQAVVLALLVSIALPGHADWPFSAGGSGDDKVVAMENGVGGDVFVVGHFHGTMELGEHTLISRGGQDIFVVRVDAAGQVVWADSAGSQFDITVHNMTLDDANNIYFVGEYMEDARFGGVDLDSGGNNGFVAKIDNQGSWGWAQDIAGILGASANDVVTVPGDSTIAPPVPESVVVGGEYQCQAVIDGDILENDNCAPGASDVFLARFAATDGDLIWAVNRGDDASGVESFDHLEIDSNNRIYAIGQRVEGGTETIIDQNFNSWSGWQSSNEEYALLFDTEGVKTISWWWWGSFTRGYSFFTGNRALALRAEHSYAYSPTYDTSDAEILNVSALTMRGFNPDWPLHGLISDKPHFGENLRFEYLSASDGWRPVPQSWQGGAGPAAEERDYSGTEALVITNSNAFHENFRIRVRLMNGGGTESFYNETWYHSWWYVDHIKVEAVGAQVPFLVEVSNVLDEDGPNLSGDMDLAGEFEIRDIALDADNDQLVIAARQFGEVSYSPCSPSNNLGTWLAAIDLNTKLCEWRRAVNDATPESVTIDSQGRVFVTGRFRDSATFHSGDGGTLESDGGSDVFIGSLDSEGNWSWVTGGNFHDEETGIPSYAGGLEDDSGTAISTDDAGSLYVGGRFRAIADFGPTDTLAALGGDDAFFLSLGIDGRFFTEANWTAGVALTPPADAKVDDVTYEPDFAVGGEEFDALGEGIFFWAPPIGNEDARLIPLQPIPEIEVRWRIQGEDIQDEGRISEFGGIGWPNQPCNDDVTSECHQIHIAGAPVEAEPATGNYRVLEVIDPNTGSSGPEFSGGSFTTERTGNAVIVYVNGPEIDPTQHPVVVEVVRSVPYTAAPEFVDGVEVEIGQRISDPFHNEPGRTGWVVNELAYYDGRGSDAAYNRSNRSGSIIPVNRYSSSRPQEQGRELVVAWYRDNPKGVYWPAKSVRYAPRWPFDPDRIIVASEQGGEVLGQTPLDPQNYPSARIYVQNDFDQPGYNPNDEHAFMAPSSTGSGHDAVFALRSDFGSNLEGDIGAASDPYVLVKYFDDADSEWRFRIYKVDATGAGFNDFRYGGTAATTVSPPYPVELLVPGCAETFVDGQAEGQPPPPPFFQDYSNQLWSSSAGSGAVHYYYPAQPNFFLDLENNDENEIEAGDCVPWLERLPEDEGGSRSPIEPIKVTYEIAWPDDIPLLTIGETLLSPKRGLPDIINQAAVEVIFDQYQATTEGATPDDTLAQLIDPLNPRYVYLDEIPSEIATEMQTDGTESILGSADGSINLPVSIRDRISYDPLNNRLSVRGIFDESGAGDPFLLLNVLSKRDRVTLKTLDGGDGSEATGFTNDCLSPDSGCDWDEAVEALFRLSRNPQQIEQICTQEIMTMDRELICEQSRDVEASDVLIGYQDEDNDGILQPFQAVGVDAALTAGLSQDTGYITVAFNNDQSLSPLPVSLEIIEVGCLVNPPPPEEPDLVASYQGQINVIAPDNIFDEQLVLRHSGDFGGNPDAVEFEWFYQPDTDGSPPMPPPDPEGGQMHGWLQYPVDDPQGAVEISIEGANIQTLSDNWYLARYRGLPECGNQENWNVFAGNPGATPLEPLAQLAEGWVKRVLDRLNPFEARVQDFAQAETNNYVSMLIQLGERYEGPVALNDDPDNLNQLGLIEAYTTVMRRAMQLSVGGTPPVDYGPANNAILLVASRLVDFYTLLGNEAFADAQDPTIGIGTSDGDFLSLAPSIFAFQNQLPSLLEEELVLLRGRDTSHGPVTASPVYNRLFWNFTMGDGEIAYQQAYDITDQNNDGVIDEFDARIMFPQGHGDAWGHYLTAIKTYYDLLRHPFFTWEPRPEAVTVAGVPIQVDFLDERQFAETAVAKARTGAEIVDLTYRSMYVEDPDGQWQGYEDSDPERAWGLSEWGRRAGTGAYYDWVTANSLLPEVDPNPDNVGIQRIDRNTVREIGEIASQYEDIQSQVDKADAGLNPLGLARDVVPFDIDPSRIDGNESHFEQIADRAIRALENAVQVWDFANQLDNQMRRNQNEVDDISADAAAQETSFSNQLIEIFGYPYPDDIGPGGTYPAGYDGPDLYHYMYIDVPALAGTEFDFDDDINNLGINRIREFTASYDPAPHGVNFFEVEPVEADVERTGSDGELCLFAPLAAGCALGELDTSDPLDVEYTTIESPDFGFWFTTPDDWTGERRAPGELQQILHQMLQARISLKQALVEYDQLRESIEDEIRTLQATFDLADANLKVANNRRSELRDLTIATETMRNSAIAARRIGEFLGTTFKNKAECLPKSTIAGVAAGGDMTSGPRCAIQIGGSKAQFALDTGADLLDVTANATEAAKEDVSELAGIQTMINDSRLDIFNAKGQVDALMREEPVLRSEIFARAEAIQQLVGDYKATLARGLRIQEEMINFRRAGAAEIQEFRYQDMAFRIFRNDALQKYRAAFEMAARYVYLAATAYDYDTNLLGSDGRSGQEFLTDIVRERSLGQLIDGAPIPGTPGLADALGQLKLNFEVLKGQMGFNNPQIETNRFSLRSELFRIPEGSAGDRQWRRKLEESRVDDLWNVPEFRRYARPFAPQSAGPQPGLVIEFSTNVTFGLNFFGWDLGPGDGSYDSSQFSTRVRSVGSWFDNYAGLPLADNPRIYLFPVGADVLRAPDAHDFTTREWKIVDQAVPIPFPIGSQDLGRFDWQPISDTVAESPIDIRRYARIPAHHFSEPFDDSEVISDSRLIGRSVWNRRWIMIIPGGTFLNDPVEGLETFIHGEEIPDSGGERDGEGIDDIRIFFETYAYPGN